MKRIAVTIIFLVNLLFLQSGNGAYCFDKQMEEWWINIPSSPLKLGLTENQRFVVLSNLSSSRIIQYRLGCIEEREGGFRVIGRLKATRTDLVTNQTIINPVGLDEDKKGCDKKRGKIAVIEVEFADGSIWKAK